MLFSSRSFPACVVAACVLSIINDILDYSKIEAGSLRLTLAPTPLVDTVESAMMLCYGERSTECGTRLLAAACFTLLLTAFLAVFMPSQIWLA